MLSASGLIKEFKVTIAHRHRDSSSRLTVGVRPERLEHQASKQPEVRRPALGRGPPCDNQRPRVPPGQKPAGQWALDHLPGEVGGPVYFCSSGVYVNGKGMGLQTACDRSQGPAWDSTLRGLSLHLGRLSGNPTQHGVLLQKTPLQRAHLSISPD